MPRVAGKSPYVVIDGQKLDRKLLQAFEKSVAGKGDGRVSRDDVSKLIAPRMKDAGKLTDIEIATIEYAAKTLKLTDAAKNELSKIADQMLGRPVFAWQRNPDVVNVRVNPNVPLSGKALEKAALDWVLHNVEPIPGAELDRPIPHLDSGNNGVHPSIITGDKAKKAVALFRELEGARAHELLKTFDPQKHAAIYTVGTEDETHIYLAILDKQTGKAVHVGHENTVDISYSVDEAKMNEIFGDWKKFSQDPDEDDFDTYFDGHMLAEWLQEGAKMLPVFHYDDAGPDNDLYNKLAKNAEAVTKALGDESWRIPADVENGKLPVVEDLPTMARLMFEAGRGDDSGIHYQHDGVAINVGAKEAVPANVVDDLAAALLASYPQRGNAALPDLKKHVKATLDTLGKPNELTMFQVSSKVRHETDQNKTTDAKAWAFINEKTGHYVYFYTRPEFP